jgi:carbon storage regulator CsrA
LVIGDDITLVISKIEGNRVSIGIEAPRDVKIMRSELTIESTTTSSSIRSEKSGTRAQGLREFAGAVLTMKRQVG